ncbi:MAG TPA: hypothetical protein VF487_03690 [Chitinophagaceae bacterium]
MKTLLIFVSLLFITSLTHAQLKRTVVCPPISVDILYGRVNGLPISSTMGEIKAKLPCFTSAEDESKTAKCGGGVFYKDKDIYFYTGRDYVEIGEKFKGKLSIPLMGAARNSLFKWLGNPKIKDVNWDAYTTAYGILILYFNKANKINKIQFSNQSELTLNLCE